MKRTGTEMWYIAPHKESYDLTMTLDIDALKEELRKLFPGESGIFYCYEACPDKFVGSVISLAEG